MSILVSRLMRFAYSSIITAGLLMAMSCVLPAAAQTVINVPPSSIGPFEENIDSGTTLNVFDGGDVELLNALSGSIVNISGGSVGSRRFNAFADSIVKISGGSVGDNFTAFPGSTVTISGGSVGANFAAFSDSTVEISGGSFGIDFNAEAGSDVELLGGAFKLNGANFSSSTITLQAGDVFTGTLQDGSPLIFFNNGTGGDFDQLNNVMLTEVALPDIDMTPVVVNAANPNGPLSLGVGQVLTLQNGGFLGVGDVVDDEIAFQALGATLNIEGGILGNFAEVAESTVNMSGGSIGEFFDLFSGSTANISGGNIGEGFDAFSGSEINLFGTEFRLDGVLLEGLELGQAFTVVDRDVTLSGVFADGTAFSFDLDSVNFVGSSFFLPSGATLTVTQVPEPTSLAILGLGGLALLRRRRA